MNPGRFSPLPLNKRSHVFFPKKEVPRSSAGSLATAKKAICIPSSIPTIAMKKKKRNTETPLGTLGYFTAICVCPLNKAERVTAKQNPKMARDMRTRAQKKKKVNPDLGSSFDWMGFPETMESTFWMRYEECITPENSTAMAV
mmetsp:Transcript_1367/g.3118  ORF Transcript_1367/g.3118 Transcript_1367/m.3118 type:complete len:143 (+) Transcript_1367:845-1273(+)